MNAKLIKKIALTGLSVGVLAFSATAMAVPTQLDWQFAYNDIVSGNYGESAGFAGTLQIEIGYEYENLLVPGEVCLDFNLSVTRTRAEGGNKGGKGKEMNFTSDEVVTYCQFGILSQP